MKTLYTPWYHAFSCTASACSDSCCIGWEIDIDEKSLEKYRKLDSESPLNLLTHIDETSEIPHFILAEEGRCPFLNEENLCNLYIQHGENSLCEICTMHPRYINDYGYQREIGLDLCCEEATRLILNSTLDSAFVAEETPSSDEEAPDETLFHALVEARQTFDSTLFQDDLDDLANLWLNYALDMDNLIFDGNLSDIETLCPQITEPLYSWENIETYEQELDFFQKLTPLSAAWHNRLADATQDLEKILEHRHLFYKKNKKASTQLRLLLRHFLYRHMLEGVWEDEVYPRIYFCILAIHMIELLWIACDYWNNELSESDQIMICVQFSKEIEYCTDNLEAIFNAAVMQ